MIRSVAEAGKPRLGHGYRAQALIRARPRSGPASLRKAAATGQAHDPPRPQIATTPKVLERKAPSSPAFGRLRSLGSRRRSDRFSCQVLLQPEKCRTRSGSGGWAMTAALQKGTHRLRELLSQPARNATCCVSRTWRRHVGTCRAHWPCVGRCVRNLFWSYA
jgi:hypothetical protein